MESFVEWGYLGLFLASFLGATIIPLSSEFVFSFLIISGYDFGLIASYQSFLINPNPFPIILSSQRSGNIPGRK